MAGILRMSMVIRVLVDAGGDMILKSIFKVDSPVYGGSGKAYARLLCIGK